MTQAAKTVALVLVLAAAGLAAGEATTTTCVAVVDGDTLVVETAGGQLTVHLAEVDAPELDQPSGPAARDALGALLLEREVTMVQVAPPAAGGVTARVAVAGQDAGLAQVAAGLAWTAETRDEQLALAAIVARSNRVGLWQEERPIPPWAWRTRTPPQPTPTPVVVTRSLHDAGMVVDLKKNEGDRAVIAGLPQRKESEAVVEEVADQASGDPNRVELQCPRGDVPGCLEKAFKSHFSQVYPGASAGAYTVTVEDQGSGAITAMFQGQSTLGSTYAVGSACNCSGEACGCVMQFAPLDAGS